MPRNHDWAEVNQCGVLDADGVCRTVVIEDEPPPGGHSVARVRLGASIDQAIDALAAALPPTDFTPDLLAGLKAAYQPGRGMADAFARWLETVLGPRGLVVYDASDPAAKPLAADVFVQEIETATETSRQAAEPAGTGERGATTPRSRPSSIRRPSSGPATAGCPSAWPTDT
jgi:uncharacterized protein YllA (UPF0747 family)